MTAQTQNKTEVRQFDAEVGKILQLMINSLYTNKDIFLRELISNASDACDKLRYLHLTNKDLPQDENPLKITITIDKSARTLTIKDNGVGMNRQELIENLGTIARSGTQRFMETLTGDSKKDTQLIGQFGVGFYSSFMVADRVTVKSCKVGENQAWIWESTGTGEFSITQGEEEILERGTSISLHLKEGEDDYLDQFRIKYIVNTYSDHISLPIEFVNEEGKETTLNKATALWTRNKNEITEEQYNEFYHHVAHSADNPWLIMHNKNEGTLEYTNLLFIPSSKPFDLFHPDRKPRVKLYVKRVFISEEGVDLIPAHLRFLRGMVDSQDLPLNISRENLQHNNIIEKIKKSIIKRTISELKKKMESDLDSYLTFWANFGSVLKEGLCEGYENRDEILEVCLFRSALHNKLISLDEYLEDMKEGQRDIYYFSGNDPDKLKDSPQLEGFLKRNIDVLLFSDHVDDFWTNVIHSFKEKGLKSITRTGIDLDKISTLENQETANLEENHDQLVAYIKQTLGAVIKDVRLSNRLTGSPVCLAVDEGAMDIRMERFLIEQKQLKEASPKILEINVKHPIMRFIASSVKDNASSKDTEELIKLLFDQACIIEGEPIKDTNNFSQIINKIILKAFS